jgi:hypothetical protein
MASWGFALAQLFIEAIGWVIGIMVWFQSEEKLGAQALEERFTAYSGDVNGKLSDNTPKFDPAF